MLNFFYFGCSYSCSLPVRSISFSPFLLYYNTQQWIIFILKYVYCIYMTPYNELKTNKNDDKNRTNLNIINRNKFYVRFDNNQFLRAQCYSIRIYSPLRYFSFSFAFDIVIVAFNAILLIHIKKNFQS